MHIYSLLVVYISLLTRYSIIYKHNLLQDRTMLIQTTENHLLFREKQYSTQCCNKLPILLGKIFY